MNTANEIAATAADENYRSIWVCLQDIAFQQGYVDAGGIRTRYIEAGPKDAPVVIMMHGMGASWESCFANVKDHAKHFRTLAFDFVGHGFSDKPDKLLEIKDYVSHLANFMNAMNVKSASLLGVSLGGWTAAKFAIAHPERVEKIVWVSPWGRPVSKTDAAEAGKAMLASARAYRMAGVKNPTWAGMEKVFSQLVANPKDRIPDLLAVRLAIYRQPEMQKSMMNIWDGVEPEAYARNTYSDEELASLGMPVLLIAAIDEKDFILETAYANAKVLPNAKLVEMPGVSHWPHWEGVERFNPISIEFLKGK